MVKPSVSCILKIFCLSTSLQYSTADGTQTQDVQQDLLIESSMAGN